MKAPGKIHVTVWLFGLAGAALFTGLLVRQGIGQVWDAFATAEWTILGIVVYHLIPVFFDALGWGVLFPKSDRPRLFQLLWMRWIGERERPSQGRQKKLGSDGKQRFPELSIPP